MKLKRYNPSSATRHFWGDDYKTTCMRETENGMYVKYEDVKHLEKTINELLECKANAKPAKRIT